MSVENPVQQADAAPAAAPEAEPSMLKLDFSSNPTLRQVATMLRRVWLLDPPLSHEELADPATAQACFRAMCEVVGSGLAEGDDDDDGARDPGRRAAAWDQDAWLARVAQCKEDGLRLVPAPVVTAAAASPDPRSVVSPWREEIYDVYRHVFADLWRGLEATAAVDPLARYDPARGDAVSLVVLPTPAVAAAVEAEAEAAVGDGGGEEGKKKEGKEEEGKESKKTDRTAFRTDTFLYPVWINPKAEILFSAADDGIEHRWVDGEQATWITGLWVREGKNIDLTTKMDGAGSDETGVAAVFVTGHCDEKDGSAPLGTIF